MRSRRELVVSALVAAALLIAPSARGDDPSATASQQAIATYGIAAAAQLIAVRQAAFYLYVMSLPPDQRSGVNEETWRTRGADLTTIPADGPIADYFTNGAAAMAATGGTSDFSDARAPAAIAPDAALQQSPSAALPMSTTPDTNEGASVEPTIDANSDVGGDAGLLPSSDAAPELDADDEAVIVGVAAPAPTVGEDESADGVRALLGASAPAHRHESGAGVWFTLSAIGALGLVVTALVARRRTRRDEGNDRLD